MGELKKLGWFYRLLCGLISSFCLIALLGFLHLDVMKGFMLMC